MAKRIKKVFSNSSQVMHIWANQSQDDARCGNVYFQGKSIYSYGRHYELGRLIKVDGKTIALINTTGYSVTTSKHIRQAQWAACQFPTINVDHSFDFNNGLLEMQDNLMNSLFDHFNRRSFYSTDLIERYVKDVEDLNFICRSVKRDDLVLDVPTEFFDLMREHVRTQIEKEKQREALANSPEVLAKKEALRIKKEEALVEKRKEEITAWKRGGPLTELVRCVRPMLIRIIGDEVQTTGGAQVPLDHATRLLSLVEANKAKQGERVGHFTYDKIDNGLVTIGCHTIELIEAQSVLKGNASFQASV